VLSPNNFIGACLFGGAILLGAAALQSQSKSNAGFRPQIPKAWDDAEVARMEIPLAAPAPQVTNISASYYYSIPPVVIYKSYPLLSPDKPFPEYRDWLKRQEPQDAFNPAKLKLKADWEKFGEFLFSFSPYQIYGAPRSSPWTPRPRGEASALSPRKARLRQSSSFDRRANSRWL
jgi:hypothetical protein